MENELEGPQPGKLLISEPFLYDPNFKRSVILLCEHHDKGDLGFILNKPLENIFLHDVVEMQNGKDIPVYFGGPVQQNTLHFLHREPDLIESSQCITEGLYWGGNFDLVKLKLDSGEYDPANFRFFIGYSGWGETQLQEEVDQHSWIVTSVKVGDIFQPDLSFLWRSLLKRMGGKFRIYANSPENPQYN
ncbi:MAG: YqgE/AlgH family protein [Bacteroidia bacterium]